MVTSINSNIAAYFAQASIGFASENVSASVARLSSGNAIVKASDNVAALSIGTGLAFQVATLKIAQQNTSLGTSLLQVADGGLAQQQSILQQMQALATQANSGSLSSTQRGFLDQQFQALATQLDSISSSTAFNGVNLLDGSLSTGALVDDNVTHASAGVATITLNANPTDAQTFIIGGVTLVAKNSPSSTLQFQIGTTAADTIANLATKLNALSSTYDSNNYDTSLGQAYYTANGNQLVITSRTGGALSNNFVISSGGTATVAGATHTGNYGGSSVTLFATGFSSATASVTAGSASQPFTAADTITAQIGGTAKNLYTLATGASLTDIVNGINANAATTGVSARLTFDPTAPTTGYNIVLSYQATNAPLVLDLGTNYTDTTHGINGVAIEAATNSNTFTASTHAFAIGNSALPALFSSDLTAANITNAQTAITAAAGSTAGATPFAVGDTITATVNGVTKTLWTVAAGNTLNAIINGINSNFGSTGVYAIGQMNGANFNVALIYSEPNNTGNLTADTGANAHASAAEAAAGTSTHTGNLVVQQRFGLAGGTENGLGFNSTSVTGTVGDNLLTTLTQTAAQVIMSFPSIADSALTNSGNFNSDGSVYITVGGHNFAFTTTSASTKAPDEITIGTTLQETLDNAVSTINNYLSSGQAYGDTAYQLNQINVSRNGNSLVFTGKGISDVTKITGAAATAIAISAGFTAGAVVSNSGSLNNSARHSATADYGVDMSGINNADFTGSIQGFTASYVSSNTVNLSVKVGNYTYTAANVGSNPSANQTVRFYSDTLADGTNGGFFDIQLAQNHGVVVSSQSDANTLATRLNAAFQPLTFSQERQISSYQGTQAITSGGVQIGSLIGSRVSAQLASFSANKLSNVSVTAPATAGADAVITFTIDGEVFKSASGLGSQLGGNQTYRLVSTTNANHFVDFTTGNSTIDLSTSDNAQAVQSAIASAFGANEGSAALTFQVGTSSADSLSVSIASVSSNSLFNGQKYDVLTQADAAAASDAVNTALNTVTATRASVGALESRFNYASANLSTSIQNQDAARGQVLDTDIASESTNFAISQVKLQAGISTLAQANQQLQSLLKLIG